VVADEEIRARLFPEILFEGVMDIVLLVHKKMPYLAQNAIDGIGRGDLPGMDLLFDGGLCHDSHPFLLCGADLGPGSYYYSTFPGNNL
jgi:hypothetical protein